MQGERDGIDGTLPESRWHSAIPQMLNRDGVQVAALQEAGNAPPPSATWTDREFPQPGVTEHLWNIGSSERPDIVHIYWGNTGQQRNSLAILSRETARNAVQLPVGGRFNSRPMMGVQFGNDWYFNAHALSNGENRANDAPDIIETARQFMAGRPPGEGWMVLGDFNNNPGRMPEALQNHIVASNQPTQQNGGELDFAYTSDGNNTTVDAERRGINSDHWFVRYAVNPNCNAGSGGLVPRAADTRGCDTPVPGTTYRIYSRSLDNAVLSRAGTSDGSMVSVLSYPNGIPGHESFQVRFSTEPGQYLLTNGQLCLRRETDNPESVMLGGCQPEKEPERWELREGHILTPGLGTELQPSPNKVFGKMIVSTGFYRWRYVTFDPQEGSGGGHDELKKRDLQIMPLGDSITYGVGSSTQSSYRADLWNELQGDAKSLNFVGSQESGQLPDRDNEGHSGWMINQIADVAHSTVPAMRPNVVMLHAGTNDMDRGDPGGAPARLGGLVDQLLSDSPGTTVLVATLVPSKKAATEARIESYNQEVRELVGARQQAGKHVELADMSAVTTADLADDLHPNDAGYRKMATAFEDALLTAASDGWIGQPGNPVQGRCPARGGTWIPRGQIASGTGANTGSKVRFADIDGDHKADYLVLNDDGSVDAWRNTGGDHDGQAGWAPAGRIAAGTGSGPSDIVTFADINSDGKADYLVIGSHGQVHAWVNDGGDHDGKPGWTSRGQIAAGVGDQATGNVVFGDINGDDRADYLVVGRNHEVTEWENVGGDRDGKAGWVARGQIASGVGTPNDTVLFGDVTCDKQDDYLLLSPSGQLSAWRNLGVGGDHNGREGWVGMGQIAAGTPAQGAVQLADINGDGLDDYLVVDQNGAVQAWINNGGDPA